jgi:hypothetical protein
VNVPRGYSQQRVNTLTFQVPTAVPDRSTVTVTDRLSAAT